MNVNFSVFIDKILSGEKRQTIRKAGGRWEKVKVGDKLTLYTGLRTKNCRKLGEAEVESVEDVEIESNCVYSRIRINGKYLFIHEMQKLSLDDGFSEIDDFLEFFNSHYGENFTGKIIKWKNFRKERNEK